ADAARARAPETRMAELTAVIRIGQQVDVVRIRGIALRAAIVLGPNVPLRALHERVARHQGTENGRDRCATYAPDLRHCHCPMRKSPPLDAVTAGTTRTVRAGVARGAVNQRIAAVVRRMPEATNAAVDAFPLVSARLMISALAPSHPRGSQ